MSREIIKIYELEQVLPKIIAYKDENNYYNIDGAHVLEKDLLEDLQIAENERKEITREVIIRYQKIVENIKKQEEESVKYVSIVSLWITEMSIAKHIIYNICRRMAHKT